MPSFKSRHRFAVVIIFAIAAIAVALDQFGSVQRAQDNQRGPLPAARYTNPDEITNEIRTPGNEILRIDVRSAADRAAASALGRVMSDHGSFVTVITNGKWTGDDFGLNVQRLPTTVSLGGRSFDPILDPPDGTVRSEQALPGGYYVVQLGTIADDALLESVKAMGIEILQYVPHQAFFVYGSGEAVARLAEHSRVRWMGAYTPEHKLTDDFRARVANATAGRSGELEIIEPGKAHFDIPVWSRADLAVVQSQLESLGGISVYDISRLDHNYFNILHVTGEIDSILRVAELSDVITISPHFSAKPEDERSSQIISGNYTGTTTISAPGYNPLTQFGVDGQNVTVAMVDDGVSIPGNSGFYLTAANVVNVGGGNVGASGGHGHLNASIIAGDMPFGALDPTGYNYGVGVAPKAHIQNVAFLNGWNVSDATVCNAVVTSNGPNGVPGFISNNSWGSGGGGAGQPYTSRAASFDGLVRDSSSGGGINPLVIVFSAGNQGTAGMTDPKSAKNIITTGSSENLRTELGGTSANNMDDLASSSSRGPAQDGRIKPDIIAPGAYITGGGAGTGSSTFGFVPPNNHHLFSSGTSHAAPQIAGAAALFTQFWKNGNGGVNPSVALVKAAILNTGQEMAGANVGTTIPNGNEGWGRLNMQFMLNTGVAMKRVNETTTFSNPGESTTFNGTVADATKPIRIALVWTDPPGAANANPALVNNLDLTVNVGGTVYRGNVFTGGNSSAGGSADTINNVEMVRLPAGTAASTAVSIQVSAVTLNGDGVLGNADTTDQHFALVAYNFNDSGPTPTPTGTVTPTPTNTPTATPTATPAVTCTLTENFDTAPPAGWTIVNNSQPGPGTTSWFQGNPTVFPSHMGATNSYVGVNFNSGTGTSTLSNWLILPQQGLKNGDTLTFFTRTVTPGATEFPDRLQVRMSTNGGSANVGSTATSVGDFTTLLLDINPTYSFGVYPQAWTQFTVTITGAPTEIQGRLAFRYFVEDGGPNGANSNFIGIDTLTYCRPAGTPTPTNTPTATPTATATNTPTATPTSTPPSGASQIFAVDIRNADFDRLATDNPVATRIVTSGMGSYFGGDFANNDFTQLYAVNDTTDSLDRINTATGAVTPVGSMGAPAGAGTWTDMSFDRTTGTMYALSNSATTGTSIYTVNLMTGAATLIASNNSTATLVIDGAVHPATGVYYGIDLTGDNLVTVNKTTAAVTTIGPVGFNMNFAQGMDFDDATGVLYWGAYQGAAVGPGQLRSINTTTGASTLIGNLSNGVAGETIELDAFAVASSFGATPTPTATPTNTPTATPTATPVGGGFEADVAPRNNGNGVNDATDVAQLRRFITGLDTPAPGSNEGQRADCAPRDTLGDGAMAAGDAVQGRRYVVGLDPLTPAGGPQVTGAVPERTGLSDLYAKAFGRELRAGTATGSPGGVVTIPVTIASNGDEAGLSFTLEYDAEMLSEPRVTLGPGISGGATLTINSFEEGRLGILIDSASPFSTTPLSTEVILVTFNVSPKAGGDLPLRLTSSLVTREVVDAAGGPISIRYLDGMISIATPVAR